MRVFGFHGGAPARQGGMSLIEVMVSVLVLAVGLIGIAAMQALALRGGQSSLESSQAVMGASGIIEAMRANAANAAAYNTAKMCAAGGGGSLAADDKNNWITSMQASIGSATTCGMIEGCPANCLITVYWDDSRAGGGAQRTLVMRAQI